MIAQHFSTLDLQTQELQKMQIIFMVIAAFSALVSAWIGCDCLSYFFLSVMASTRLPHTTTNIGEQNWAPLAVKSTGVLKCVSEWHTADFTFLWLEQCFNWMGSSQVRDHRANRKVRASFVKSISGGSALHCKLTSCRAQREKDTMSLLKDTKYTSSWLHELLSPSRLKSISHLRESAENLSLLSGTRCHSLWF